MSASPVGASSSSLEPQEESCNLCVLSVPRTQGCICEDVAVGRATLWGCYRGEEARALESL